MQIRCEVIRGNRVESEHNVEAVVVNSDGVPVFQTNHPDFETYVRSSAKPFQAYPLVASGAAEHFHLSQQELAICCASHNSEPVHVETVRALHKRTGLTEEMLRCGVHTPLDSETAEDLWKSNTPITQYHNNCSGKHTGMLLACKHQNFPMDDYIEPGHPLQAQIRQHLQEVIEREPIHIGIDGCSVPTFYMSLRELATAFLHLADQSDPNLNTLYDVMTGEPYLVAGRNRFDTEIMQALPGTVISKVGAEGVRALGIRVDGDSYGLALKVRDGSKRASGAAVLNIFQHLGWFPEQIQSTLADKVMPVINNHAGLEVGHIAIQIQ